MGSRGQSIGSISGRPNAATEHYVSGEGMWINQYLRDPSGFGELSDSERHYLKDLDKATDGIIRDSVLYRSVDARSIFGSMADGVYENLYTYLVHGDKAFGKGAYADGIRRQIGDMVRRAEGKTVTEKGYMSTTSDWQVARDWQDFTGSERPIVLEITPSARTRGVNLSGYDRNTDSPQHERLLARGQSYKVNKVGVREGNIYVQVKMQ